MPLHMHTDNEMIQGGKQDYGYSKAVDQSISSTLYQMTKF